MLTASAGIFLIDFVFRPFAKICEKWPPVMLLMCIIVYGIVGYIVIKSVYVADQHQ